jgi:signal transduction histidine kinase
VNNYRTLVIEDNPGDVRLIQEMLREAAESEFAMSCASRLDTGLKELRDGPADVVLLDLNLPDTSGIETFTRLQAEFPRLPVVILTGLEDSELAIEAVRSGAQDYLVKADISTNVLVRVLRYAVERKRVEQTLEARNAELADAIQAKDRFLASMSHELRTPMNAIIGFTGTLLMELTGPLNDEQHKQLETIEASANHLLSLINDLLDLAKIESGKLSLTLESVRCCTIVDELRNTLRPLAERKDLGLRTTFLEDGLLLKTDRRALRQILFNLTNNAVKFTEQGEIHVVVSRQERNGQPWVQFSVHDTGVGIKPEDHVKLFQPFSQVGWDSTCCYEGTGLGLYLSRKLAALLGGQIGFKSECGKGSTFTLYLPER